MALALSPTLAHADSDDDEITRYDVHATIQPDGSVEVELDFDFDFGRDEGHGPYLSLPERMAIPDDPDHWRSLPISDITASSETAPADLEIDREGGAVLIRIGNEDVDLEGTHRYRVSYRMGAAVNPEAPGSGLDEFSWNAVGTEWEIPLRNIQVTVEAPVGIERVGCSTGRGFDDPCATEPTASGTVAQFAAGDLEPGQGLQVVAGMPAGTFPELTPILTERYTAGRVLGVSPQSLAPAGLVAVGGAAAAVALVRRRGHRQFADVPPGHVPDTGPLGRAKQVRATGEIPLRAEPPQDVAPGLVGVLDDMVAGGDDVTATIIDLAVRGHLRIEEHPPDEESDRTDATDPTVEADPGDPEDRLRRLVRTEPPAGSMLRSHEQVLLDALFAKGPELDLAEDGALVGPTAACQKAMYEEATNELGWFNGNPSTIRTRWVVIGVLILVLGLVATFALGFTMGLGFIGVAAAAVGLLVCILAAWAPGRTALGTAVWTQAQGFKQYLDQVDADQIAPEPGVDLWSMYLPWAMLWGSTGQWTGAFATLADRGTSLPTPAWYVGITPWMWHDHGSSILGSVNALSSSTTSAMTAASTSSGGGSGFAGGGGVGGGGGGGW